MSIKIMNWVWGQEISSSAKKLVLLALADRANDDGDCWPGIASLIEKCSIPRRTLLRALAGLQTDGLISVHHRAGEGAGRMTNVYHLHFDQERGQAKCQSDTRQSAKMTPGKVPKMGGQSAKNGGAKCQSLAPNTSVEPSINKTTLSGGAVAFLTDDRLAQAEQQGFTDHAWIAAETVKFLNARLNQPPLSNATGAWLNWLHKGRDYAVQHPPQPPAQKPTPAKPRKSSSVFVVEQNPDPSAYRQPGGRFARLPESQGALA